MEVQQNESDAATSGEPVDTVSDDPASEPATATEGGKSDSQTESRELNRRGDVEKCPVCGSHVDADAYHCPSCRNYFCFHCRARLVPPDVQLQCVNQDCDYYGKLVCDVCDVSRERDEAPTLYAEPEDGYWPGLLLLSLVGFGFLWYFKSLQFAAASSAGVFFVGGVLMQLLGVNIFGKERTVQHQRKSAFHDCICCGQEVKEISQTR